MSRTIIPNARVCRCGENPCNTLYRPQSPHKKKSPVSWRWATGMLKDGTKPRHFRNTQLSSRSTTYLQTTLSLSTTCCYSCRNCSKHSSWKRSRQLERRQIRVKRTTSASTTTSFIWWYKVVCAAFNHTHSCVGTHLVSYRTALRRGHRTVWSTISATSTIGTAGHTRLGAARAILALTTRSSRSRNKVT